MILLTPSLNEIKEIKKTIKRKTIIPVFKAITADLETPVSAYYKVCKDKKYSYLLESVEKGETFGRHSYIGLDPIFILKSCLNEASIVNCDLAKVLSKSDNPYDILQDFLDEYDSLPANIDYSPGTVGYFSFDSIRFIEEKLKDAYKQVEECESFPQSYFMLAGTVLIFDHLEHKIYVVRHIILDSSTDIDDEYNKANKKIDEILEHLSEAHNLDAISIKDSIANIDIKSNITKDQWVKGVLKAKEHILNGDIFQVVLSQRFCIEKEVNNPFNIYRALRIINPSPYLYYLNFDEFQMIGSSPEIMVQCTNNKEALIRPIAGTRPRGNDKQDDIQLEKELLNDPKEIAEHVMLVDLGRNDLGRVCEFNSVKVKDMMHIERFSHVMHIVSDVIGKLKDDKKSMDLLKAAFPAGTLSGAPKIKALEIIYDIEKSARGPYGGCIGSFGFNNEINTAITIRTMLIKDNKIFVQAGAGIVADSNPENEYEETKNKAAALVQTISRVENI